MKRILLLFVLLTSLTLGAKAQSMLVATLTHDTEVTNFLGPDGLKNAYKAAVDGDVITLSSGSFNAVNISKAITVRGAGMLTQPENDIYPTLIMGSITIDQKEESEKTPKFEGIYFSSCYYKTISKALFTKCRFENFTGSGADPMMDQCVFIQCIFKTNPSLKGTVQFFSCRIGVNTNLGSDSSQRISFHNCVIHCNPSKSLSYYSMIFNNCIFITESNNALSNGNATGSVIGYAYNCVCIGKATDYFKYVKNSTNQYVDTPDAFFTNGIPSFDLQEDTDFIDYTLTEAAAQTYLGLDGTQVGMYGGSFPFDPIPTGIRLTKFNVAPKSTVDGKLSVDISVSVHE